MKVTLGSEQPMTDESVRAATGKTWEEWWAYLDERGGPKEGRRNIGFHLNRELNVDPWWSTTLAVEYEEARGQREKDGRLKGYYICSTKTINAPLEDVFAAWLTNESLNRWLGVGVAGEPTEGGALTDEDGALGTVKRVRANKDIRIAWEHSACAPGSVVDVMFQDKGKGKTAVFVNHDRLQSRAEADGVRAAWNEAMNRLKSVLEG
jgi:uncharacterized protein YndB with AHSA1/START domain